MLIAPRRFPRVKEDRPVRVGYDKSADGERLGPAPVGESAQAPDGDPLVGESGCWLASHGRSDFDRPCRDEGECDWLAAGFHIADCFNSLEDNSEVPSVLNIFKCPH